MIPLRETKNDIHPFVNTFIKNIGKSLNITVGRVCDQVLKVLENYSWPRNVRELQNVIEKVLNIIPGNDLTLDILPIKIVQNRDINKPVYQVLSIKDMEQMAIMKMLL